MAQVVTRKIFKKFKKYFQKKKKKGSTRIRTRTRTRTRTRFFIYLNRFLIKFCDRHVRVM